MIEFGERPLFILELANNHMGSLAHGLRIIDQMHEVTRRFRQFSFAVKMQYRHLDTFIHPDFVGRSDIKYVKRFSETRLTEEEQLAMRGRIQERGFLGVCTPFDEPSVDRVEKHGYDILKIASCSLTDWPLLERAVKTDLPLIVSTAGVTLDELGKVISFLEHRSKRFAVMHCVGEYPTPAQRLELNQIDFLRQQFPGVPIGFSTHEEPGELDAVKIAIGKGAALLEKHVGVPTDAHPLNAYSADPQQVARWIESAAGAFAMCGLKGSRREFSEKELADLRGLKRGVFAKRNIRQGEKINLSNCFLAIPNAEGQLLANDLSKYMEYVAEVDIRRTGPVMLEQLRATNLRDKVLNIVRQVRDLLVESGVRLPNKLDFEISHHYGIDRFSEWGGTIISIVNREYCKKLIILLPGQKHPTHAHRRKEETFHILFGDMTLALGGEARRYTAGDVVTVERGVKHNFSTEKGLIVEEISTTHFKDDSYYDDERINQNRERKTEMTFRSEWLEKAALR